MAIFIRANIRSFDLRRQGRLRSDLSSEVVPRFYGLLGSLPFTSESSPKCVGEPGNCSLNVRAMTVTSIMEIFMLQMLSHHVRANNLCVRAFARRLDVTIVNI